MLEKKIQKLGKYLQEGKFLKLKAEAEKILSKNRNAIQALQYRAIALMLMKRFDESQRDLDKALKIRPKDAAILDSYSNLFYLQKDYSNALKYVLKAIDIDPRNLDSLERLGDIYAHGGNAFRGILAYKGAYLKGCRTENLLLQLAKLLRSNGRIEEAQDVLNKMDKDNPKRIFEQVNLFVEKGDVEKGTSLADQLAEHPKGNLLELIGIYKQLGDMDTAKDIALKCRDLALPVSAFDIINFGGVDEEWINNYLIKYPENKIEPKSKLKYLFSLAAYFKKKDKKKWFEYITKANELKQKAAKSFSIEQEVQLLDKVINEHKKVELKPTELATAVPIFIVGMPRSGTTLTETIIGTHSQCMHIGESTALNYSLKGTTNDIFMGLEGILTYLDDLSNLDLKKVGEDYIRVIRNNSRQIKHIVDKMPHNFLHVGVISKAFPNAKIIHCRRNPIDTCLSIYEQNFKGFHSYGNNLDTLIPYYKKYQDIMAYWKESLPEGSFYESDYEALTSNPEEEVRKLLDYCNLPFEQQCLEFNKQKRTVKTASVEQVRQGIYKSSQKRWAEIEEQVKPLLDAFPEYVS